jgi:hypothetical protein
MLRLISDVNFNGRILRGLRRRLPGLDLVRASDAGLGPADDPSLLQWSAAENRILLTHDVNTIPGFAYDRVRASQTMPGVFLVRKSMAIGKAIEELVLAIECLSPEECKDIVTYFPL